MQECIFCKIVSGQIPSYKVYEDEDFLAFLDIFPSHKAQTLVVPKKHISSKFSVAEESLSQKLVVIAQKVARQIETKLEGVERCLFVCEGMEIDHLHIKLYPAYLPNPVLDAVSKPGQKADSGELAEIAKKLQ